jgi:hypothetical protein
LSFAARSLLVSALALTLWGATESSARAQTLPAGAISGHALFTFSQREGTDITDQGYGGILMADITYAIDWFRIGGAIGVGAATSNADEASRVLMPLTVSLGAVWRPESVWIDLRGRVGMWAGATNQGLAAGALLSIGAFVGWAFADNVAVGPVFDAFFAFGHGDTIAVAPGLSLVWVPNEEDY